MSRCRTLIKENDDLAKSIDQGQLMRLDAQIALAKRENDILKETQSGM
jgi:hypothetical protein